MEPERCPPPLFAKGAPVLPGPQAGEPLRRVQAPGLCFSPSVHPRKGKTWPDPNPQEVGGTVLFMPWCEWCWGEEPGGVLRAKLGNAGVRVSGVFPCSGEQGGFLPAVVNPPLAHGDPSLLSVGCMCVPPCPACKPCGFVWLRVPFCF